ncbi:MAG: HNH endonuclease [Planctomycetota bacterium]|jgi:hypothetical protein
MKNRKQNSDLFGAESFSSTRRLPAAARSRAVAHRGRADRQEQRSNRKKEPPKCEDCEYSSAAVGAGEMILTCDQKKPSHRLIVLATDSCEKFVRSRELIAPHLAQALAEGARLIPLTRGKFAIVDAEDFEWLNRYKWNTLKGGRTYYARSWENGKTIRMHRLITNAPKGLVVDHINHNGMDNRKQNLRLCTRLQNARNRRSCRGSSSKYKGVSKEKKENVFIACIRCKGKLYYLGRFKSEIAAAKTYDKKAKELFGEFAFLNFPDLATD